MIDEYLNLLLKPAGLEAHATKWDNLFFWYSLSPDFIYVVYLNSLSETIYPFD
jgi:hypothetical protein